MRSLILFIFFVFSSPFLVAESCFFPSEKDDLVQSVSGESKKIAICYWGLTRSTKKIAYTHYKNLFDVLSKYSVKYSVFMHTWKTQEKQRVWDVEVDVPIDYEEYQLLNPDFYQIDDQDEFTNQLEFGKYYYKWDDDPYSRINLLLAKQGKQLWLPIKGRKLVKNLILNHLCALESLKRVTEMVENSGTEYDLIMYIRPDAKLNNKIPIENILKIQDLDIVIPDFDHCGGYNDRFAVLNFKTAPLYGKRIKGLAAYKKAQGYFYSEDYLKYVCDSNHLNVIPIPFHFDLIRP